MGTDALFGLVAGDMADGNPNGYYVLSFDGDRYKARFKAASQGGEEQMRIVLDPPLITSRENHLNRGQLAIPTKAVVNVFDGGERNVVELSIDGGEFQIMQQVARTDPYMESLFIKYQNTEDASASPAISSHIWEFTLPGDLEPGVHKLTVRSIDMFDQISTDSLVFEIDDSR